MKKLHLAMVMLLAGILALILTDLADTHVKEKKILLFTKSSGFQHSAITRSNDLLGHAERVMVEVGALHGYTVFPTKDGRLITAENLKNYDAVAFYTSGNLTESGTDQFPAVSEQGMKDLYDWVKNGGGFSGWHSAVDTIRRSNDNEPTTEFTRFIGAAFKFHGRQEEGTVVVVDPKHPTMMNLPISFRFLEEWYVNDQWDTLENIHVLQMLDTQTMEQEQYKGQQPFPITWCSNYGKGRVYVSAIGHREDVWDNTVMKQMIINAFAWTSGDVEGDATPNYKQIMDQFKLEP